MNEIIETPDNYATYIIVSCIILGVLLFLTFLLFLTITTNKHKKMEKQEYSKQDKETKDEVEVLQHSTPKNHIPAALSPYLPEGTLLQDGRYRVEQVIGEGGFGITYLGEQVSLCRKVAIKEFYMKEFCERDAQTGVRRGATGSADIVERCKQKFLKEARLLASLDFPHIVRIHDVFEENGTAYYVMDYIEGETLKSLTQSRPMAEGEAIKVIREVASALDYIHARNILHLDVKPANIIIRKDNHMAVLIDFGISKHYDDCGGQTSTTPIGVSKGYAPLEQYNQSLIQFTAATDIYSLGATLYSITTGQVPPEATIVNEDGLPDRPTYVSPQTYHVIEVAMTPQRKRRPQSIKEFLNLFDEPQIEGSQPSALDEETRIINSN